MSKGHRAKKSRLEQDIDHIPQQYRDLSVAELAARYNRAIEILDKNHAVSQATFESLPHKDGNDEALNKKRCALLEQTLDLLSKLHDRNFHVSGNTEFTKFFYIFKTSSDSLGDLFNRLQTAAIDSDALNNFAKVATSYDVMGFKKLEVCSVFTRSCGSFENIVRELASDEMIARMQAIATVIGPNKVAEFLSGSTVETAQLVRKLSSSDLLRRAKLLPRVELESLLDLAKKIAVQRSNADMVDALEFMVCNVEMVRKTIARINPPVPNSKLLTSELRTLYQQRDVQAAAADVAAVADLPALLEIEPRDDDVAAVADLPALLEAADLPVLLEIEPKDIAQFLDNLLGKDQAAPNNIVPNVLKLLGQLRRLRILSNETKALTALYGIFATNSRNNATLDPAIENFSSAENGDRLLIISQDTGFDAVDIFNMIAVSGQYATRVVCSVVKAERLEKLRIVTTVLGKENSCALLHKSATYLPTIIDDLYENLATLKKLKDMQDVAQQGKANPQNVFDLIAAMGNERVEMLKFIADNATAFAIATAEEAESHNRTRTKFSKDTRRAVRELYNSTQSAEYATSASPAAAATPATAPGTAHAKTFTPAIVVSSSHTHS